ncbi:MAG TPA: TonB C-terminal domain-containing protein [Oculatellaceae cyanobacterium]
MQVKKCLESLSFVFVLWSSPSVVLADAGDPTQFMNYVSREVRQNWEPLQFAKDAKAQVQLKIYATGRIADVKLVQSTGNAQADSSCLDAIYELDPLRPMEEFGMSDNELTIIQRFEDPDESHNHHCDQKNTAKAATLNVFHAIPIGVFYRYPNEFQMNELHETKNLRLYDPRDTAAYWSMKLEWATFFRYHPKASRQDILSERDRLDAKFQTQKVGEGS